MYIKENPNTRLRSVRPGSLKGNVYVSRRQAPVRQVSPPIRINELGDLVGEIVTFAGGEEAVVNKICSLFAIKPPFARRRLQCWYTGNPSGTVNPPSQTKTLDGRYENLSRFLDDHNIPTDDPKIIAIKERLGEHFLYPPIEE